MAFLTGPYEHWIHGYGRRYLPITTTPVGPQYMAALAEGLDLDDTQSLLAPAAAMLAPTLWKGAQGQPDTRRFLPMLLRTPSVAACQTLLTMPAAVTGTAKGATGDVASRPGLRLNMAMPSAAVDAAFAGDAAPVPRPHRAEGVSKPILVAVIDDGMSVFHRGLRDQRGKTRVEYFWQQSGKARPNGSVLFGREYDRPCLDGLINDPGMGQDEDALYRHLQDNEAADTAMQGNIWQHSATHGAHIMDMAAGTRPGDSPVLDNLRIIAVQLPTALITDTTGFGKDALILAAFHYIFDRADRLSEAYGLPQGQGLPLVINLSYGFTGGPHDGTDRLEGAIRDLVAERQAKAPTGLTLPAGNSFHAGLNGCVDNAMCADKGRFDLGWQIQANDRTANYLELWLKPDDPALPRPGSGALVVNVTDPDGCDALAGAHVVPNGVPQPLLNRHGEQIGQISLDHFRGLTWRTLIVVGPTETRGPEAPQAAAGLWQVKLTRQGGKTANLRVECRIQRDTDPLGHRTGARQSVFLDWRDRPSRADGGLPVADTPGAFLRRMGTLNGLATHDRAIVVGGYVGTTGVRAPYSSVGTGRPGEASVHCSAITDDSWDLPGRRASGLRSGSSFRLVGTSTAAPQVARAIALTWLLEGEPLVA